MGYTCMQKNVFMSFKVLLSDPSSYCSLAAAAVERPLAAAAIPAIIIAQLQPLQPTCSRSSAIKSSCSDPSSYCSLAAAAAVLPLATAAISAIIIA